MNNIFHKQIRKIVLVLFDDILIYNKIWKEHLHHLEEVLKILHDQSLFVKLSNVILVSHIYCNLDTSLVNMV